MVVLLGACSRKTQAAATVVDDGLFNPAGFPVVNRPFTLKVFTGKHPITDEFSELPFFKDLEATTGIHIEWEYATDEWGTQKPLRLASGDLPDIFFVQSLGESDVVTNPELFVPMESLIEQYGANLRAIFQKDPSFEKFAKAADGHIYGLPAQRAKRPATFGVWGINQDWLDNLGLAVPTTTEELYQVLKAFKERDANGNGKADEIGISVLGFDNTEVSLDDLFGAFGLVNSYSDNWITVTDGKVQYMAAQEGFVDAIAYFHRLFAEGLLDPETFSHDWGRWRAKGNPPAGEPDLIGVGTSYALYSMFGMERSRHYTLLLPLKGPKGDQYTRWSPDYVQRAKYLAEITVKCQYPEIALRWLDALYDEDMSLQLFYGPYGERLEKRGDGTIYAFPAPEDGSIDATTWSWKRGLNSFSLGYTSGETNLKIVDPTYDEQYNQKLLLAPYFPKEYYPTAASTPEEADELAILRQDIHTFSKSQAATWIVNGGVEREYPAFLRQIEAMGLQRMVDIYQTMYDRHMQ
jgi:putative aldouronate transport system substrate-binding protein